MIKDAQGQPVSGATEEAVALYDQAVRAMNLACGDAVGLFDKARAAAPAFAMAQLGKAWSFALARDPAMADQLDHLLAAAQSLTMNDREQGHLAALRHVSAGALSAAVSILDPHLMRYPFDILAHQVALFLDQFQGRVRWMRDRTARALPLWPKNLPGYGALLTFHGFGLEETGDYARADDESRAALELDPTNSFAHHTVAHVMEMTGRPEDGLGWMLAREPSWTREDHFLQNHIWWHRALFHLELGQHDAALALYDGSIRASQTPLARSLTNGSALLWRLATLGYDVSDRWNAVAMQWQGHADGRCFAFHDMHAAMAELGSGQEALVERRLAAMRETAASGDEAASIWREVGIPLVEGLMQFHRGRHEAAVASLLPVRFDLWRIGGSHAQRDVVDRTLAEAAVRGGIGDVALALANERLAARPRSAVNRQFLKRAEQIAT
jgi:tetratricopeptide (TPR) repeat protein